MPIHDDPEYLRISRKFLHKNVRVKPETSSGHAGDEGSVVAIDIIHGNILIKVKGKYEEYHIDSEKELVVI